jgi:hypothetical protein
MATMKDLSTWLLEQIAEDERIALEVLDGGGLVDPQSYGWQADSAGFGDPDYGALIMCMKFAARWRPRAVLAECAAKRAIIEWHKNWPVLVETPPNFEPTALDDPQSMTLRITKQIAWLTQQQYRERFGDEPPTAPMLRLLALPYADRPGYQESWRP